MSRLFLRIVGSIFLGCALLTELKWIDKNNQLAPPLKPTTVTIENKKLDYVSFTPRLADIYSIRIKPRTEEMERLNCSQIANYGIKIRVIANNQLVNTSKGSCYEREEKTVIIFRILQIPALDRKHFIYFWIDEKQSQITKLQALVKVDFCCQGYHYAMLDLGFLAILGWGLLAISLGCFLPDICDLLLYILAQK